MAEHPIIFSGEMVRAILDGRKTQTRRVIKPQPQWVEKPQWWILPFPKGRFDHLNFCRREALEIATLYLAHYCCPYGVPGDTLWVREAFQHFGNAQIGDNPIVAHVKYRADGATLDRGKWENFADTPHQRWWNTGKHPWSPSIHMPRWACRLELEVTKVRVERVQEISFKDIHAEGVRGDTHPDIGMPHRDDERSARIYFMDLWDSINAKRGFGWDANPFVWVIDFKLLEIANG